ncbi:MDR family MFS transporter [Paenibacillus lutimineralis]|uniref:DHA2 family efflux MFS transporter permease subunit n=1 Tax=Paenibacillus lutimineralis TaxID=2707005 RepID=A0A3S9UZ63_9BACL|nr:MDR family MFS transporter [Paenibacillus lutimineralis]AZS15551.1 DHA2 family efflux MFS transporter permease subunit [Paenibacillus lutimineralis]
MNLDLQKVKRMPIMFALMMGAFVATLNETLLGNALPVLMKEFQVGATTIQWLTSAYLLVVGALIPITAVIQQWLTTRQLFSIAMITFLIGTIVAATSPSFIFLLIGRVIQAIGTGLIIPLLMNTLLNIYPAEKRGSVMGVLFLIFTFAPAIGPTLSGLIIDVMDWRWLFYSTIPITIISIIIGYYYLINVTTITKPKIDVLSIILSTLGFGGVVYGFSASGTGGWSDPQVYWSIIIGGLSLILFAVRQLRISNPILELRTFRFPLFSLSIILLIIVMMAMFSTITLLPMFMQSVLLVTAFQSGLIMLPGSVLNGLMSPVTGKLFDRFGAKVVIIPGLLIVSIAMYLFTGFTLESTSLQIILTHCLLMLGVALVLVPVQTYGLNQITPEYYAHGSAIFSTLQQVSGAIGSALFIATMSARSHSHLAQSSNPDDVTEQLSASVAGYSDTFMLGFIISIIAVIVALFLRKNTKEKQAA